MGEVLVLAWRPSAGATADVLAARLARDAAWRPAGACAGAMAWRRGEGPAVRRSADGRALLVGEVHPPVGEAALAETFVAGLLDGAPGTAARRLARSGWGAYVAVFGGEAPAVFRDPSGALEAFAWEVETDVWAVARSFEGLPAGFLPRRMGLDWAAIGRILRQPGRSAQESPLSGVTPLAAGRLTPLARPDRAETIWSPAAFARRGGAGEAAEAAEELARRIDGATAALAGARRVMVGELSGGLDSAVTASALRQAGLSSRVAAWINYHGPQREGDERAYARAVAARLDLRLTEVPLRVEPVTPEEFARLAAGVRPPMSALGRVYDTDMAARARALGAEAILTGQGGDAALFQMPTPMVLADALRGTGAGALFGGLWGQTARWTGRSAWSVLAAALRPGGAVTPPPPLPGLSARAGVAEHPWLAEAADLPPAKQVQISALASAQVYPGDSDRRRACEVLRPLLTQPVLELVLATPVPVLIDGGRDRGLARRAFADRLPPEVIGRRSKGGLGAYYGQVVLASLDWLGPHLLDGCLCEAGLIDRAALARALEPEALVERGGPVDVLAAALMESWVRHWQGRAPDAVGAPRAVWAA